LDTPPPVTLREFDSLHSERMGRKSCRLFDNNTVSYRFGAFYSSHLGYKNTVMGEVVAEKNQISRLGRHSGPSIKPAHGPLLASSSHDCHTVRIYIITIASMERAMKQKVARIVDGVGWSRFLVVLTSWRDVGHGGEAWRRPLYDAGRRGRVTKGFWTHNSGDLRPPLVF
jgi:hypothetical protein